MVGSCCNTWRWKARAFAFFAWMVLGGIGLAADQSSSSGLDDFFRGTTFNPLLDIYYGYNFNDPIGRANLLRAYDVSSNSFSLNQADLVIDHAVDPDHGRRLGLRLDLQLGQATQTLQGNPINEPRPDIYRNIFQAYGTYVIPLGRGLTFVAGKWSSSIGIEGNYTKDQMNYSRSFWYALLPFYHMGASLSYPATDWLTLNYWITNGTQQTEDWNGFKDQLLGVVVRPTKSLSWTLNGYLGQENPDVIYNPSGAPANLPRQQGTPFEPISPAPDGKLAILDSYLTWNATDKLTFAVEGDYVSNQVWSNASYYIAYGGAAYARYQLTDALAASARVDYVSDQNGYFGGVSQSLYETTLTAEYQVMNGWQIWLEWRRDASSQPYFLTQTLGALKNDQSTVTVGMVWWLGGKTGSW